MATDIIARGMAANAKKSVTELGNKIESEKWIGTKAEWEAVDKSTIKDGTIVYITDDKTVILYDKAEMEKIAAKVAEDRTAAETAAQTAQSIADSLPDDYVTAVGKIAENTAEIANAKLTDKELQRRVNALYDIGQGVTHKFETDTDTAYVKTIPTGGKLMSVKSVGGRSLVWNQMCSTFTYQGTECNCKPVCSAHKYLCRIDCEAEQGTTVYMYFREVIYTKNNQISKAVNAGKSTLSWITSPYGDSDIGGTFDAFLVDGSAKVTFSNRQIFDLTAMFGSGNEPSTVEEFEKIFPADYYPYNAGEIISAGTEEVVEQGANLYYGTDMLKVGSDDYEYIANSYRCKSIKLKPNTTYTLSFNSDKTSEIILLMNVTTVVNAGQYFDFRKASHTQTYTTGDDGCLYVGVYAGNGNVASADVVKRLSECKIMISEGDTPTAYAPYHSNTHPIPEAIRNLSGYGWSAGTARNYVDYENKRYVQCVSSVDLGTLAWSYRPEQQRFYAIADSITGKFSESFGIVPNIIVAKYDAVCFNDITTKTDNMKVSAVKTTNDYITIRNTAYTDATAFKQAMQGVILYYELATPIVTDISSLIPDDFLRNIEVEAGGSITFKNSNDSYRIPVPSEEEYIVKLSEVGGTT
ncbi:MAG: hypothetical protein U0K34_12470 [Ruminococcus sp.]|nr:hypothetical protein [Ruminococcus sp.]